MSRSRAPSFLPPPPASIKDAALSKENKLHIAEAIGLKTLPDILTQAIAGVIGCYYAGEVHTAIPESPTTVGNIITAIEKLEDKRRRYASAMQSVSHELSGVDDVTQHTLQPFAMKCLDAMEKCREAMEELKVAANTRRAALATQKIYPDQERKRWFFGTLKMVAMQIIPQQITSMKVLREFAAAVADVANIEYPDYVNHPERFDDLLNSDVSTLES